MCELLTKRIREGTLTELRADRLRYKLNTGYLVQEHNQTYGFEPGRLSSYKVKQT